MFKKTAIVATAAAGMLMLGSPAFATTPVENDVQDNTNQAGLLNVDDVLSNNQINVCPVVGVDLLGQIGLLGGANENMVAYCSSAVATDN